MLHVAVERNYNSLVKYLIDLRLNVNDREGCGLTPLSHAVLQKNKNLVDLLIKCGAQHCGPMFTSIPSPVLMARTMDLTDILHAFEEDSALSDEENFLIRQMDSTFDENEGSSQQVSDQSDNNCNNTSRFRNSCSWRCWDMQDQQCNYVSFCVLSMGGFVSWRLAQ